MSESEEKKSSFLNMTVLILCILVLGMIAWFKYGFKGRVEQPPCAPLPVVDGYVTTKTQQGGITLKLPTYANPMTQSGEDRGCQYVQSFAIDYLWYEGKLIPEGINRFKVPLDKRLPVTVYFWGNAYARIEEVPKRDKSWNYEGAIPHKFFPLEYYPKYYWDDPVHPSEKALKRARLDQRWGIRDTKYKDVSENGRFQATCSLPYPDPAKPNAGADADFGYFGDSKCRGWILANKNGKTLSATIDVWAYRSDDKKNQTAIRDINHIYDAAVEQLQSFIQE